MYLPSRIPGSGVGMPEGLSEVSWEFLQPWCHPPPPLPACTAGTAMTRPQAGGNIYGQVSPSELNSFHEELPCTERPAVRPGVAGADGAKVWTPGRASASLASPATAA